MSVVGGQRFYWTSALECRASSDSQVDAAEIDDRRSAQGCWPSDEEGHGLRSIDRAMRGHAVKGCRAAIYPAGHRGNDQVVTREEVVGCGRARASGGHRMTLIIDRYK